MLRGLLGDLLNNDVTAGDTWYYPGLEPVTLRGSRNDVIKRVRGAFEGGGQLWEIQDMSTDDPILRGTVTTPGLGFVDDFTVRIEPRCSDPDKWTVIASSSSRVGIGDLGKNANNIRSFYRRLRDLPSSD